MYVYFSITNVCISVIDTHSTFKPVFHVFLVIWYANLKFCVNTKMKCAVLGFLTLKVVFSVASTKPSVNRRCSQRQASESSVQWHSEVWVCVHVHALSMANSDPDSCCALLLIRRGRLCSLRWHFRSYFNDITFTGWVKKP